VLTICNGACAKVTSENKYVQCAIDIEQEERGKTHQLESSIITAAECSKD